MRTAFTKSFARDLRKHGKRADLLARIREIILEVEAAETLASIRKSIGISREARGNPNILL